MTLLRSFFHIGALGPKIRSSTVAALPLLLLLLRNVLLSIPRVIHHPQKKKRDPQEWTVESTSLSLSLHLNCPALRRLDAHAIDEFFCPSSSFLFHSVGFHVILFPSSHPTFFPSRSLSPISDVWSTHHYSVVVGRSSPYICSFDLLYFAISLIFCVSVFIETPVELTHCTQ